MALYEHRCRTCGEVFEVRRPMSESGDPAPCPGGHADTVRLLSVFASVGRATGPDVTGSPGPAVAGGCCGGACGCGR